MQCSLGAWAREGDLCYGFWVNVLSLTIQHTVESILPKAAKQRTIHSIPIALTHVH